MIALSWRRSAWLGALALAPVLFLPVGAHSAGKIDRNTPLALRLPQDKQVVYRGVSSLDGVGGGTASMLYPAPNVAGLLAAVITHGVLAESTRRSELEKVQEAADKVLVPYQAVLQNFEHRQLMERGLEKTKAPVSRRLLDSTDKPAGQAVIESTPVFSMTQDQSALILDNAIVIYAANDLATPAYKSSIRVVARAKDATDFPAFWTAHQGEPIKEESARLFAVSLDLALREAAGDLRRDDVAHKTVRYEEGKSEKMERAQVLSDGCGRLVIRTLREFLMSVPAKRSAATDTAACASDTID